MKNKKLIVPVFTFLLGLLVGNFRNWQADDLNRPVMRPKLGKTSAGSPPPMATIHQASTASDVSLDGPQSLSPAKETVTISKSFYDSLKKISYPPLSKELVPEVGILVSLGAQPAQVEEIRTAFQSFVTQLAKAEAAHKTLISSQDGEHYAISKFELPASTYSDLENRLISTFGVGDERASFLLEALNKSPFAAGLGHYRQELAVETERDTVGRTYPTVRSRWFDDAGKQIGTYSYVANSAEEVTRAGNVFK